MSVSLNCKIGVEAFCKNLINGKPSLSKRNRFEINTNEYIVSKKVGI